MNDPSYGAILMFAQNSRSFRALSVAVVFLLAGFAMPVLSTASIRVLQISKSVAQNFQAQRFCSDFRYYTLMDGDIPYAIVGCRRAIKSMIFLG
jgi:hypothetical protein